MIAQHARMQPESKPQSHIKQRAPCTPVIPALELGHSEGSRDWFKGILNYILS